MATFQQGKKDAKSDNASAVIRSGVRKAFPDEKTPTPDARTTNQLVGHTRPDQSPVAIYLRTSLIRSAFESQRTNETKDRYYTAQKKGADDALNFLETQIRDKVADDSYNQHLDTLRKAAEDWYSLQKDIYTYRRLNPDKFRDILPSASDYLNGNPKIHFDDEAFAQGRGFVSPPVPENCPRVVKKFFHRAHEIFLARDTATMNIGLLMGQMKDMTPKSKHALSLQCFSAAINSLEAQASTLTDEPVAGRLVKTIREELLETKSSKLGNDMATALVAVPDRVINEIVQQALQLVGAIEDNIKPVEMRSAEDDIARKETDRLETYVKLLKYFSAQTKALGKEAGVLGP